MNMVKLRYRVGKGGHLAPLLYLLLLGFAVGGEKMITQKEVREAFDYREDGVLIRRVGGRGVRAGDIVGALTEYGYIRMTFNAKSYMVHKVVFLFHKGYMPKLIDHKDRNKGNNRIENLRDVTKNINSRNTPLRSHNTSGKTGVTWDKHRNKWQASLTLNGKPKHLGRFKDFRIARLVRIAAEIQYYGECTPG